MRGPGLAAALQHPQAHNIFEQARGSIHSALIRKVESLCFR